MDNYPLAPEKLGISNDMFSKYCSDIGKKYGIKVAGINKSKYIVHYKNLQLYLLLGTKLVSVHRTLTFNQSDW